MDSKNILLRMSQAQKNSLKNSKIRQEEGEE